MKVIIAHTPYEHRGGEDVHVEQLAAHYLALGFKVDFWPANREAPRPNPLQALASLAPASGKDYSLLWAESGADFLHIHNAFPALGIPFFRWLADSGTPALMTVHNHRFFCTNGLALRDGKVCKDCFASPVPWRALAHNCNGDWQKTAYHVGALAQMRTGNLFARAVRVFIAPSPYVAAELERWGMPAGKIRQITHPILWQETSAAPAPAGVDFFYAGRLSPEKGIENLIQAAALLPQRKFLVSGQGPLLARVQYMARKLRNLRLDANLSHAQVLAQLQSAKAAVVPSLCNETLSIFALEAFASGRPCVVPDRESTRWLAEAPFFGLLADTSQPEALAKALEKAATAPAPVPAAVQTLRQKLGESRFRNELRDAVASLGL